MTRLVRRKKIINLKLILFCFSANYFPRWMNGSCKECQPVKAEGQDEAYLYTFFPDVVNRPEMRDLAAQIHNNVQKTVTNMKRNLLRFKKYKTLWKADKVRTFLIIF